jgi:DNA-binding CsgD family transcriptional regulator
MAAEARGAVELAEDNAEAALGSLRRAFETWRQVEAPYEAARVRVLLGMACRAFGDDEGAGMELDAARAAFEQLGAVPDLARVAALTTDVPRRRPGGLTQRELQVLRLVAAGKTNKAVAQELSLSEKTIDRHVSNIFNKLDVPSRAAATAFAYEHKLL